MFRGYVVCQKQLPVVVILEEDFFRLWLTDLVQQSGNFGGQGLIDKQKTQTGNIVNAGRATKASIYRWNVNP